MSGPKRTPKPSAPTPEVIQTAAVKEEFARHNALLSELMAANPFLRLLNRKKKS